MSGDAQNLGQQIVKVVDNIGREIGGTNGSALFNPFAQSKAVGGIFGLKDDNLDRADTYWRGVKKGLNDAAYHNVLTSVDELTGANKRRQGEYETQKKNLETEAFNKMQADNLSNLEKNDRAGSNAASRLRQPGGRGSTDLNYNGKLGDSTDFLGL